MLQLAPALHVKSQNRVKKLQRNLFIKFFMITISYCRYNITCYNITIFAKSTAMETNNKKTLIKLENASVGK